MLLLSLPMFDYFGAHQFGGGGAGGSKLWFRAINSCKKNCIIGRVFFVFFGGQ